MKNILSAGSNFYTFFPCNIISPPFVYFNATKKEFYTFAYQRIPIKVFVYGYSPTKVHSTTFKVLKFLTQNSNQISFEGNFSEFSGIVMFNQSFIVSPYYWHKIVVSVKINNSILTTRLTVKFPYMKVLFDDNHRSFFLKNLV